MPGVYVSYPFCAQKCSYCNFASGVQPRDLEPRYLAALRAELAALPELALDLRTEPMWGGRPRPRSLNEPGPLAGLDRLLTRAVQYGFPNRDREGAGHASSRTLGPDGGRWPWTPETVFLGGGTPSRIDPGDLADLLSLIPGRPWVEATIEAAPGSITAAKAEAWRDAGINRASLGVQSFVQRELARTGRTHTAEIVASEVATLRLAGLTNFNIDLIAGLPHQTLDSWNASLDWIARLEPPHVSVYMLEVDEDSRLGAEVLALGKRYGAGEVPGDDAIADFYEVAVERLASLGIPRYEISNFARAGFESRHNLKYWRREPYLGFGADAHSFDGGTRWQNAESAAEYVERIERSESPVVEQTASDSGEIFFLGLRLSEGVEADWSPYAPAVEEFARQGLIEIDGTRLRLTPRGVLLSNEVFAEFI